jgi:23S rRNA (pseudouridine1915-N3)-methyltransferase
MKIQFWSIGKQHDSYVEEGIQKFTQRIQHYFPVEWKIIAPPKNAGALQEVQLKEKESVMILSALNKEDFLVLLDERGKMFTNEQLASMMQEKADTGIRQMIFLIGGAFGVDEQVRNRAQIVWSFSKLVFPHQLVRLMLAEQIYRSCTIMRNESYHHT